MDRNRIKLIDDSDAAMEEAALRGPEEAAAMAAARLKEGRDPETGESATEITGVLSHERKDALRAAVAVVGGDPDDFAHLDEMSIEQLQERIAELEAARVAKEVRS